MWVKAHEGTIHPARSDRLLREPRAPVLWRRIRREDRWLHVGQGSLLVPDRAHLKLAVVSVFLVVRLEGKRNTIQIQSK